MCRQAQSSRSREAYGLDCDRLHREEATNNADSERKLVQTIQKVQFPEEIDRLNSGTLSSEDSSEDCIQEANRVQSVAYSSISDRRTDRACIACRYRAHQSGQEGSKVHVSPDRADELPNQDRGGPRQ